MVFGPTYGGAGGLAFSLVAFGTLVTACGEQPPSPGVERAADMYQSAVEHLVEVSGVELNAGWDAPVIFVEVLEADAVDLETQVAVVEDFDDAYRIRFVDALAEAIDIETETLPVREGTLLVVLGPIERDGTAYTLHAEYYRNLDHAAAYEYEFEDRQPASAEIPKMVLTGEPTQVATELVVETP